MFVANLNFLNLLVTITILGTSALANHWVPQLGTVQHPKVPGLSHYVRKNEVTKVGENYYRALTDVDLSNNPDVLDNLPSDQNAYWRKLKHGSYMLPKTFNTQETCAQGDIFHDVDTGVYYRAHGYGHVSPDWRRDIVQSHVSLCQWEIVDDKENWMSLLRPEIGDIPLGDLIIPGSHDSGTSGIDENSILVDRNFLFQIGERISPDFIANWSLTHSEELGQQLTAGFRQLDLRIADTGDVDGQFRWWHGMSGDEITLGLQQIGDFARSHPEEVIILYFGHFAAPGNALSPTVPISFARRDNISDLILEYLGDHMTNRSYLTSNPTMNEVLATGNNLITIIDDSYIRDKDDRYWEMVVHDAWVAKTNPEEIFIDRSEKLKTYKELYANQMTDLSGAATADEKVIVSALVNAYGDNETVWDVILSIVPGLAEVNTANISFEGLWLDLFSMARYGVNTQGMYIRPAELYTNGASVHFRGLNDQIRHWVARPDLYKPNIIYKDDTLQSNVVDTAIQANKGDIPREVSISLQGNPKSGYYEWDDTGFATIGGTDGVNCSSIDLRYTITDTTGTLEEGVLNQQGQVDIAEGFYPPDASVRLDVMSDGSSWNVLWSSNIQVMITENLDVYIRGGDLEEGNGFAYVSTVYNDYGSECFLTPDDATNILEVIVW